ncbi:MAG TPA: HAD family hydrolase [Polyangiaceae bacterium]|nr:HAD family hydrolase [Polyangiaceae bacterium]
MNEIKCVILDFDGTLTDPNKERARFETLYRDALAGATVPAVVERWAAAARKVDEDPETNGLRVAGGQLTAPGDADVYIRCFGITQLLGVDLGLAPSLDALMPLAAAAYAQAYGQMSETWSRVMFREETEEFLDRLRERGLPVWLVTNAESLGVKRRLSVLADERWSFMNLRGLAQKFWLAPPRVASATFDALPSEQPLPRSGRPVKLKRGPYFEALRAVWDAVNVPPRDTLVVGDVYDLDLALPAALGARVHWIQNHAMRGTYDLALDALEGRGSSSKSLLNVLSQLDSA